ncbi:hypothetical protein BD626DRAFT_574853 [Schizophyllum amplum]|uniref:Uncharacterized protein n=1 Tax=Schizophyllum amplum TaxID=97359 RepID=A0A550BX89_9AGAR|nr:hypothetical protein BD626DRAFT_574853 [Auriculariopsis ampla]
MQITTLSPKKLTDAEALDVSGKTKFAFHTPFGRTQLAYYCNRRFPPGTHGFLYFTSSPASPSIRFRIVDGCDPADFENGRDLLLPDGVRPWSVSEKVIMKGKVAVALRRLLAHEGLGFRELEGTTAQWPQTLDPARLTPLDAVTLSGVAPHLDLLHGRVRLAYTTDVKHSFPETTRGYLYYDITSLSVRFRVVGDSMDFGQGSDLLLPDEQTPWCISFRRLASRAAYTPIRRQLLLENLVSERQIQSRTYVLSTLDRTRLIDADWVDLSSMVCATMWMAPAGREPFNLELRYSAIRSRLSRFPDDTRGFLYWHVPEEDPYGAELRFRCAESLAHFARGHDLMTPNGQRPWSLRLRGLAQQVAPFSGPLLAYLKQAGLTNQSVVDHLAMTTVTHMRDLFLVRFCVGAPSVRLRAGSLACSIVLQNMPWAGEYRGAALARLVVIKDTPTTIYLGMRIVTLLYGPRKESDGKAWSDNAPKEGQLIGVPATEYNRKRFWLDFRGAAVRKSSKKGQVLLEIMEQSGNDAGKHRAS